MRRLALAALPILLVAALAGCTSKGARDDDGDLLANSQEKAGHDIIVDELGHRVERHVNSDPVKYDTDNDGLSDQDEYLYPGSTPRPGLDSRSNDTDKDGLSDCQETLHTVLADCENPDFGGPYDGGYGTQPDNADSDPGIGRYWNGEVPFVDDTETHHGPFLTGDGLSDGDELKGFDMTFDGPTRSVHVVTNPLKGDTDGDGLDDGEEVLLYHTNPTVPDTDGDGCTDGHDPIPGNAETYDLGLDKVRISKDHDAFDPSKGADLRLVLVLSDRTFSAPGSGTRSVQTGETADITDLDPGAQPPNCGDGHFPPSPFRPWLYIGIAAFDDDGTATEQLDFFTTSQAGHAEASPGDVYWNVRTGQFSWGLDGTAPFNGPLHLQGADGELWLTPHLL